MNYDKYQQNAIDNLLATSRKLSVLTGGPGRGKTTILKELISQLPGETLTCCPTGKGAKVMEEALPNIKNSPKTIHRMLGSHGPGAYIFNEKNKLVADTVICDEASMVGSELLARVIDGVPDACKIILVGDADQLPPVPAGAPFRDICKKTVNRLIINYRQKQGSLIADTCDRILKKEKIQFGTPHKKTLGGEREDDLFFIDLEDKELIPPYVLELCREWHESGADYQILAPQHSGVCGVENLNKYLQEKLNPAMTNKPEKKISVFLTLRLGDKVINKKNNYKLNVFNGYVGTITKITVEGELTIDFDGLKVVFPDNEGLKNLKLAYCLTIHSSQGSEYRKGIIVCHSSHYYILSNSLLYVAVSRFKDELYIIGNQKGLARAIKNSTTDQRKTFLADELQQVFYDAIKEEDK